MCKKSQLQAFSTDFTFLFLAIKHQSNINNKNHRKLLSLRIEESGNTWVVLVYSLVLFSFVIQTFKCKTGKYQPLTAMLSRSNQPHFFKIHTMEQKQKDKPGPGLLKALANLLPSTFNRRHKSSLLLIKILSALPELYFTFAAVYYCKRRVGQQSTCISISKEQQYHHQCLFLNKKTRLLLFILEIVTRNLLVPLFSKFMNPKVPTFEEKLVKTSPKQKFMQKVMGFVRRLKEMISRSISSAQELMSNVEWMTLIVYLLDWNKHFTFVEALLGIPYGYTYKNDQIRDVSYAIEGYLLLVTFFVKAAKNIYSLFNDKKAIASNQHSFSCSEQRSKGQVSGSEARKEKSLCRICSNEIKNKSSTKCGHVFCWSCVIRTLEMTHECPICHSNCEPRQVAQIRNH